VPRRRDLIEGDDGQPKRIGIRRAHLEEDTGKSIHVDGASLIDLNRAGVPLLEIVTEADMRSGEEAYRYLVKLRTILRTWASTRATWRRARCAARST
jgi:aspartyl-tRNA(Asn)/glutamyl-tRNA(Gln) amidotransferase subunit B